MKQAFFASVILLAMSVSPIYMLNGCTFDKPDKRDGFVLEMVGDKETIGANVFVNDKIVGSMTKRTEDVSSFADWFPVGTGTYKVEVKKAGYPQFREVITVGPNTGKYYLAVSFSPESKGK